MTALTWEKGDSETLNVEVVSVLYYAADSTAKSGPQRKRRASALVCSSEHRAEAGGGAGVVQGMGSADSIQSGDTAARRGLI